MNADDLIRQALKELGVVEEPTAEEKAAILADFNRLAEEWVANV